MAFYIRYTTIKMPPNSPYSSLDNMKNIVKYRKRWEIIFPTRL